MRTIGLSGVVTRTVDMSLDDAQQALGEMHATGPVTFGADECALLVYPADARSLRSWCRMDASLYTSDPWPRWLPVRLVLEPGAHGRTVVGMRQSGEASRRGDDEIDVEAAVRTLDALVASLEQRAAPQPHPATAMSRAS